MAIEIVERRLDDVYRRSGVRKEAETTVEFSYQGRAYTIDLTNGNKAEFDDAIQPFLEAATEVTGRKKAVSKKAAPLTPAAAPKKKLPSKPGAGGNETEAIRVWARSRGMQVSDRGRVANDIKTAYYAEHPRPETASAPAAPRSEPRQQAVVEESSPDFEYEEDLYKEDLFEA